MSIKVTSWALNDAPVDDPVLVLVLVAMAERANDDGTATYQAVATIARKARVSVRTCQTRLRQLEEMGLIRRGDQNFTAHLKAGQRPVVYDIAVHLRRGAESAPLHVAGVQDGPLRGATSGIGGVQRVADNSSLIHPSESSGLFEPPAAPVKVKKQRTAVPDSFVVTADMKGWAVTNAPSVAGALEFETKKFLERNRAEGKTYLDWTAAWRTWMLKAHEWSAQAQRGKVVNTGQVPQGNGMRLGLDYGNAASTSTR